MRATPTPRQRHALATLGYVAPLLRLMRCEVARVVWRIDGYGIGPSSHNLPPCPSPVAHLVIHALGATLPHGWVSRPDDEVAVNFDTAIGLVDVHRHHQRSDSESNIQLWIPNWSPEPVPTFPQPLGSLVAGTLDSGGAGVLADWIDDHTSEWGEFTSALRRSTPDPFEPTGRVDDFRYAVLGNDSACWLMRTGEYAYEAEGDNPNERVVTIVGEFGDEFWFIGFGVVAETGFCRHWCLTVPPPVDPAVRDRLLASLPTPPREAA